MSQRRDVRGTTLRKHTYLSLATGLALLGTGWHSVNAYAHMQASEIATGPAKQVEYLDRGLVVIPTQQGNAVSWRKLASDPESVEFTLYRNGHPIQHTGDEQASFFLDMQGQANDRYQVKAFMGKARKGEKTQQKGEKGAELSNTVTPWDGAYLNVPLNKPALDWVDGQTYSYSANDASVADLDGDGQYEILLKWYPSNAKDNSQAGVTGNTYLDAYTLKGEQLWRIDLGPNIRSGAHYTQFIAYDFDGDGRAEIAMKTADGTVDGRGTVIGDADARYRSDAGYILEGPEYLTMFDGLSGEALDSIDYVPQRGSVSAWGDSYGNRVDRFLAGVAYLNGETPSLVMARGYYTRAVVAAFDWIDGAFAERWVLDTDNGGGDEIVYGQGAHSLSVGDVDGDGKDEIVYGAATIDDDGHALYSTELGHGDAEHMTDIDPQRPGMEIFMVHECPSCYTKDGVEYGVELHDAATGEILWQRPSNGADVGRGVSADIDPRYIGNENWGSRGGLVAADGTYITDSRPNQMNFVSWWDGDLSRELLDGTTIYKWDYDNSQSVPLLSAGDDGAVSNNGTKATPALSADILGDWREELLLANSDSSALMLYSSPIATEYGFTTLMQEPQYRAAIAWQNVGYNQPPHPGFYLGSDMTEVADPQVSVEKGSPWLKLVAQGYSDQVVVRFYAHQTHWGNALIYRSTSDDPESAEVIGRLHHHQQQFIDSDVSPDVTYYYWAEVQGTPKHQRELLGASKTKLTSSLIPRVESYAVSSANAVEVNWFTQNIPLASISIYRAQITELLPSPTLDDAELVSQPEISAYSWTDSGSVAGQQYQYWLVFARSDGGDDIVEGPIFAEHLLTPKTNLTSVKVDGGIQISWDLQDFPQAVKGVQIYRNTKAALSGRTRVNASAPTSGTFVDTLSLSEGTTYWYMFKLTMADGTTYNTDPEADITY